MVKIWQPMAHVVALEDPTTITLAVILSYKIQHKTDQSNFLPAFML